jgi:LysM repeat protein
MQDYFAPPERRYPSPSAQRRSGEHWKARVGLGFVVILTLVSAAIMFRIAGLGLGALVGPWRAPPADSAARPTTAVPAANPTIETAGSQTAPAPAAAPQSTAPPAPPSPTARPGQREYVVQSGDTLAAIAQRNGTTVDELVAANNLRSRDAPLTIGQRLIIP